MCLWVQPQDGMQTRHMTGHTNNRPAHTNRWTWSDGAHRVKEGPSKERWWRLVQPLWNIKCTSERPSNCSSFVHLCPDKEGPAWPNWFLSSLPLRTGSYKISPIIFQLWQHNWNVMLLKDYPTVFDFRDYIPYSITQEGRTTAEMSLILES